MHAVAAQVNATCVARDTGRSISERDTVSRLLPRNTSCMDAATRYVGGGRGCFILLSWKKEGTFAGTMVNNIVPFFLRRIRNGYHRSNAIYLAQSFDRI